MAQNHWLKREPLDDEIPFEEPLAMKQAMDLIIGHKVKTKQDILNELSLPREEIEAICGMNPNSLLDDQPLNSNVVQINFKK